MPAIPATTVTPTPKPSIKSLPLPFSSEASISSKTNLGEKSELQKGKNNEFTK